MSGGADIAPPPHGFCYQTTEEVTIHVPLLTSNRKPPSAFRENVRESKQYETGKL